MIEPSFVSAVLVTRGNVPLERITASIRAAGIRDIVVWDNSKRPVDLSCYGRYAAIPEARGSYVYQQDDDLVAPVADILAAYDPLDDAGFVVANNERGEAWRLTGRGAIFHRGLADCFDAYTAEHGDGAAFHRVADIVFAYSNLYREVDLGWEDLPWASAPDASMYLEHGHYAAREIARDRVRRLYGDQARIREQV